MDPIIQLRHITKTYAQGEAATRALDDVALYLHEGDITIVLGLSGSGKTTLLSIMGCILRPTSGSVRVRGEEVTHLRERDLPRIRRERIGFIFQGFNLFPALTALQNVSLALDVKGVDRSLHRKRAGELLEQVGLVPKLHAYPADLGGQKQRLAIARALAGDPPMILADEPTAALDSRSGRAVMVSLQQLAHDRGRAVVIVTHDSRLVGHADRIVRLEDGRIVGDERTAASPSESTAASGAVA
jgi:putative ABC transport system ATP-binding protein